jgi:hypothetical protein
VGTVFLAGKSKYIGVYQEAGVCVTFGRLVQIQVKIRYWDSSRSELSIGICMGPIRGGGGGVGPPKGILVFLGGSLDFFWDTFSELKIYERNPELKPSRLAHLIV